MIDQLLSPRLVEALGWTLLHSLWQGAALALLLAVVLIALRSYSSRARYTVAAGLLAAFFLTTASTAYRQWHLAPPPVQNVALTDADLPAAAAAAPAPATQAPTAAAPPTLGAPSPAANDGLVAARVDPTPAPLLDRMRDYYAEHLPLLVTLWLVGVFVLQLRFLGQLAYVQRLRHYGVRAVPDAWRERLRTLEERLRVQRTVAYRTSTRVDSPLVTGWLRPVILFPEALWERLADSEVYAIFAHELAHVRRDDFAVNLLQTFLCNVFFFHPGVWWMSARVDEEREHCCDDLAVAATDGAAVPYARTLLNVSALGFGSTSRGATPAPGRSRPELAMALTGKPSRRERGGFATRIKRLFGAQVGVGTYREGFATACILFGVVFLGAALSGQTAGTSPADLDQEAVAAMADTSEPLLVYRSSPELRRALGGIEAESVNIRVSDDNEPGEATATRVYRASPELKRALGGLDDELSGLDGLDGLDALDDGDLVVVRVLGEPAPPAPPAPAAPPAPGAPPVVDAPPAPAAPVPDPAPTAPKAPAPETPPAPPVPPVAPPEAFGALFEAIDDGNVSVVERLLEAHPELAYTQVQRDGFTPLLLAAFQGEEEIATLLAKAMASEALAADAQRRTANEYEREQGQQLREQSEREREAAERAREQAEVQVEQQMTARVQREVERAAQEVARAEAHVARDMAHAARDRAREQRERDEHMHYDDNGDPLGYDPFPGWTALIEAADEGDLASVKRLVMGGAEVEATTGPGGVTALSIAASEGHGEIVDYLLDAGASINGTGGSLPPLHTAAEEGHLEIVQTLLSAGADKDLRDFDARTALMYAAEEGHAAIAGWLLSQGADANLTDNEGRTALDYAAAEGHAELARALLAFGGDDAGPLEGEALGEALRAAAGEGHLPVVANLLTAGAAVDAPDARGRTALMTAAAERQPEVLSALLAAGANAKLTDQRGWTALHYAAGEHAHRCVELLLEAGAAVDARADYNTITQHLGGQPVLLAYRGATPLIVAQEEDDHGSVELLLRAGADANVVVRKARATLLGGRDGHEQAVLAEALLNGDDAGGVLAITYDEAGWTPLHEAAERGHVDVLRMLLAFGGDLDQAANAGLPVREVAEAYGNPGVVEFLDGVSRAGGD